MAWRISEKTSKLLQQLHELQSPPGLFRRRAGDDQTVTVLEQIAAQDEPAAISAVARCLIHQSADVRDAANRGVHRLLSRLPPEQLLHLSGVLGCSWGWYISDAWEKFAPGKVETLVTNESARPSILGIASFHHNGYVRHEAVRLLTENRDGHELPYLLIRQNDWVEPISVAARSAIQNRLTEDYLAHFITCLPLVLHLIKFARYDHSDIVRQVIKLLVQPQHDAKLLDIFRSQNRAVRRSVVQIAFDIDGDHQRRIVQHGLESDDGVLRLWCAKRVRSCVSGESLRGVLNTLRQDRFMPVRREALLMESDEFPESVQQMWKNALLDRSASIRELARNYIDKVAEFNAAAHYRQALADKPNSLAALNGLGETGGDSDLSFIREYLKSPLPTRRRAALRGLAKIGRESVVADLVDSLQDDSPGVVGEVRRQLEEWSHIVDGERVFSLVTNDPRQHVRLTALRIVFELGKWRSLPFLIQASAHEDQETAKLAQEFVVAWFSPPRCNRVFTRPSEHQRDAIQEAVDKSKKLLEKPFLVKLLHWLDEIGLAT